MISNGSIYVLSVGGTSFDENGDPINASSVWIGPIECNIKPIRVNNKGKYIDGQFTQSSYEILVEMQDFEAEIVSLVNNQEGALGEFKVQDIEFLNYVQRVKITV